MYKDVAKRVLAVILSLCMVLGMADFSTLTVKAATTLTAGDITLSKKIFTYNGTEQAPDVTVNGTTFSMGEAGDSNYIITWPTDMINADINSKKITVAGQGEYEGTVTVEYLLVPKSIDSSTIVPTIKPQLYTGSAIVPERGVNGVQIVDTEVAANTGGDGILTAADFTYECENNIEAGEDTAIMNIYGSGNYNGTTDAKFSIHKKQFGVDAILTQLADQVYDGTEGKQYKPTFTFTDGNGAPLDLEENKDYRVEYECEEGKDLSMPGVVNVTIIGLGNYEKSVIRDLSYRITKNISGSLAGDITLNGTDSAEIAPMNYNGSALTPIESVFDNGFKLTENVDYVIYYEDNTNAGSATAAVWFQGCYSGFKTVNFTIQPGNLTTGENITIDVDDCTYTGLAQEPEVKVTFDGNVMTKDTDYTVSYDDNTDAGEATVTITGEGNLIGSSTKTFKIAPIKLTAENVSVENATFNGMEQEPYVTVKYNGKLLNSNTDYKIIKYQNNIYAGTATVTVEGTNNYTGTVTQTFTINPIDVTTFDANQITATGNISTGSFAYTGSAIKPDVETIVYEGFTLIKNKDYTITGYENNKDATEVDEYAYVVVNTKGNYTGQLKLPFTITAVDLQDAISQAKVTWTLPGKKASDGYYHYTYNFEAQNPKVTLRYKANSGASEVTVSEDDYNVTQLANGDVGKKTITITGTGNFTNSITIEFFIDQLDVTTLMEKDFSIEGLEEAYYLGLDANGEVVPVVPSDGLLTMYYKGVNPISGTFTGATNNTAPGEGELTFETNGNFTGEITKPFTIKCNVKDANIQLADTVEKIYTGSPITLADNETEVYFGSTKLDKTDYTLAYEYTEGWIGETTVSLVSAGDYCYIEGGDAPTATFEILPQDIGVAQLQSEPSKVYTGSTIVPGITYGDTTLEKDTHYTVVAQAENANDTNVGNAQVTIQGSTPYFTSTSSKTIAYKILERDITDGTITFPSTVTYENLDAAVAAVQFYLEDAQDAAVNFGINTTANFNMVEGTDYKVEVTYTDDVADVDPIGAAKLTITGKGNFKGQVSCNFLIQGDLSLVTFDGLNDITYTGSNIKLDEYINVEYDRTLPEGTEKTLVFGTDYTLEYADSCDVADDIAFTIVPVDDRYVNSKVGVFSIQPKSITTTVEEQEVQAEYIDVDWGEFYYNFGNEIQSNVTVKDT